MKKTLTVYSMLFLFVFTFALSFTLASSAYAVPECCEAAMCPGPPPQSVSIWGHKWRPNPWSPWECIYTGEHFCDEMHIC